MSVDAKTAILSAWDCALAGTPVTYLSGPITTGPRLVAAVRAGEPFDPNAVMAANGAALREAARILRSKGCGVIVEPASLTVPDWTQPDYIELWKECIGRFAQQVRFMPGWQFSAGCAAEFAHTARLGLPMLSLGGDAIAPQFGRSLLQAALAEIRSLGPVRLLESTADALTDVLERMPAVAPAAA